MICHPKSTWRDFSSGTQRSPGNKKNVILTMVKKKKYKTNHKRGYKSVSQNRYRWKRKEKFFEEKITNNA